MKLYSLDHFLLRSGWADRLSFYDKPRVKSTVKREDYELHTGQLAAWLV